jgi:hypothetical protein
MEIAKLVLIRILEYTMEQLFIMAKSFMGIVGILNFLFGLVKFEIKRTIMAFIYSNQETN